MLLFRTLISYPHFGGYQNQLSQVLRGTDTPGKAPTHAPARTVDWFAAKSDGWIYEIHGGL